MLVMSIVGLLGIIIIIISDNPKFLKLEIFSYILLLWQGILGIFLARNNLKNVKYFVSWDENELHYHLPNNSEPVNIRLTEIRKIEREPQKIRIELKPGEVKYFRFNNFYFPTRQTIFDYFESLKQNVENKI